jgi:hypothetical protein
MVHLKHETLNTCGADVGKTEGLAGLALWFFAAVEVPGSESY